jgi:hypothetical protein
MVFVRIDLSIQSIVAIKNFVAARVISIKVIVLIINVVTIDIEVTVMIA